jgi:hypothetical protein
MTKKNALVSAQNDVPKALELLAEELRNLTATAETPYKTTGLITGFSKGVKDETNMSVLIQMYGSVTRKSEMYDEAQKALGLTTAPALKIASGTAEEVKHDIKLRIAIVNHSQRKAELEKLIEEGKQFLTREDQYAIYLQKIGSVVSK